MQHNRNTVNREQQGLQQMVRPSAGMDVNWAPTDRISFSTGYVHESNFQKQCGSVWNPLEPSLYWPSVSGTPIFLGIDQKNYWAQIVGVTLKYNSSRLGSLGRVVRAHLGVSRVPAFLEWCICPTGASAPLGEAGHQSPTTRNLAKTHYVP